MGLVEARWVEELKITTANRLTSQNCREPRSSS